KSITSSGRQLRWTYNSCRSPRAAMLPLSRSARYTSTARFQLSESVCLRFNHDWLVRAEYARTLRHLVWQLALEVGDAVLPAPAHLGQGPVRARVLPPLEPPLRSLGPRRLVGGNPEVLVQGNVLRNALPGFQPQQFPPDRPLAHVDLVLLRALPPD